MAAMTVSATTAASGVRRQLSYRTEHWLTIAAMVFGGVAAASAEAQPTQVLAVDIVLVVVLNVAVIAAAAMTSWWMLAISGSVAAAIAIDPVAALLGFVATGIAGATRWRSPHETVLRSLGGTIVFNALLRSELDGFFGLSALVSFAVLAGLIVGGLRGREERPGRRLLLCAGGIATGGALGAVAIGWSLASAASDMSVAADQSRDGVELARSGDYEQAADLLADASRRFERSQNRLAGPLIWPARVVPVAAQHVRVGAAMSGSAADVTAETAALLQLVDGDALRLVDNRVDLAAMAVLSETLADLTQALDELERDAATASSPWLVAPARTRLDAVSLAFEEHGDRVAELETAARIAPSLLGADGPVRYLVLFATPAEARGVGGFIGNFAEVTIDDGRVAIGAFSRRSDLEEAIDREGAACRQCPAELLENYGRFGFGTADTEVDPRVWSNLTMSADFPAVAAAAAELYPQSGGRPLDGVLVMDPYVLQALMYFTGPVHVPELGATVTPEESARFILRDQYRLAGDEGHDDRIDGVAVLADHVTKSLLAGSLPDVTELVEVMRPLIDERRLSIWTRDVEAQSLVESAGAGGALPPPVDGGFAVSLNNAGANKIDAYLNRTVELNVLDGTDGRRRLVAEVVLTNGAPGSGLSAYVIGNEVGLDDGFSRLLVSFYGPAGLESATMEGEPVDLERRTEAGWSMRRHFVDIAPGHSVSYRLIYDVGPAGGPPLEASVAWEQPLARE